MADMWMVRAGKNSILIDDFEKLNVVAIGWWLGDLMNKTPDEIKELVYKNFPNNSNQTNGKIAANEIKFRHEIKKGDYVLSYNSWNRYYLFGKITSDYYYDPFVVSDEYSDVRNVEWLCKIPKDNLKKSTQNTLGAQITVFYIDGDAKKDILNVYNGSNNNDIKQIRILPMSNQDPCCSTYGNAIEFLSNKLITQKNCHYHFKSKFDFIGNTLILFQYESKLIAKAIFTDIAMEESDDYKGYFVVDENSIQIFKEGISLQDLNKYVEVKKFSQAKQILKLEYLDKIYQMIDDYTEGVKKPRFESKERRNIIYFGAPGTGKSYNLNQDKDNLLEGYENNYERVTFHPDYSYANFVGTYKPVPKGEDITYKYVPGPFMRILKKAIQKPSEPYLLIIEEINRANVAAVFGVVFQLLDRTEDYESEYPIDTSEDMKTYLNKDKIKLPSNLFIWATMNSADQGVFPMDTAFKRRWDFKYFSINHNEKLIENTKTIINDEEVNWNKLRKQINDELLSYKINEDKLMGPFFAFNEFMGQEIPTETFKDIFKNKIIMYLFEDAARAKRNDLFSGAKTKDYVTYSEICEEFDRNGLKIFKFISDDE